MISEDPVVDHFSGASEATTDNSGDKQDTLAPKADRVADLTIKRAGLLYILFISLVS